MASSAYEELNPGQARAMSSVPLWNFSMPPFSGMPALICSVDAAPWSWSKNLTVLRAV